MVERIVYSVSDLLSKVGGLFSLIMVGIRFILDPIELDLQYLDAYKYLYTSEELLEGKKELDDKEDKAIHFTLCQRLKIVFK